VVCCHASASDSPTETYSYDAQGNLVTTVTRLGRTTTTTPDAFGRLSNLHFPVPAVGVARPTIVFGYNALNRTTSVKDPRGLVTSYTINGLDQTQQVKSPDTGSTTATFDAAGNPRTVKDSRAITATFTHDALDRVTSIAYPNWKSTSFIYGTSGTSAGRLASFSDESGSTSYSYDGFGRLLTKTQFVASGAAQRSLSLQYAYGTSGASTGKPTSMTYPSGLRLNVTYDATGRVASFAINPTQTTGTGTDLSVTRSVFTDVKYSAVSAPTSWNWGGVSGNMHSRTYDLDGRVTSYLLGGIVRRITYDDDGRLTKISGPPEQSFDYDGLGRLTRFDSGTQSYTYAYDANGNRVGATIGSAIQTVKVNVTSNKLISLSSQATKNYQFDTAGNQISDGTISITYSPRGRPGTVKNGSLAYSQLFNALGERVFKSSSNTVYLYNETGQLIGEYDIVTGKPYSETIYFGSQPVAVVRQSAGGTTQAVTTQLFYVHTDHLETPRMITAAADNTIRWRWDASDPFGLLPPTESFSGSEAFVFNQRMSGQYYDRESNLFYNYQRDYDPQTGRYIQSDPTGLAGGLNTYLYAGANPALLVDPTGEIAFLAPAVPYIITGATAVWRAYRVYKTVSTISKAATHLANTSNCDPAEEAGSDKKSADDKKTSDDAVNELTDGLPGETDKRGRPVKGHHVNDTGDAQKDLGLLPGQMGPNGQKNLPDGSTAGVHTSTTTGAQTLHIHRPAGSRDIKIRYPGGKQ